jgi:hypothetical protein
MQQSKLFSTILMFLILSNCSYGQNIDRKNYFPIWTFHQDSINIHGISLGLGTFSQEPRFTNTNGIKFELIGAGILVPLFPSSPIPETDSAYFELNNKPLSERINGLNLSASGTVCHCETNGISLGFIGQVNHRINGVSASFFMNFSQQHNGLMTAFFLNEAFKMNGLQLGLLLTVLSE